MSIQDTAKSSVKAWDPLMRIFQWSLVFLFLFSFITGDGWFNLHLQAFYAVTLLLGFWLFRDLVSTRNAGFASIALVAFIGMIMLSATAGAGQNSPQQLETYRQEGIDQVDAQNGRQLWYSTVNERSCTSCHGNNPASAGKHVKTGKVIQPMASSVNGERYQEAKKMEKWFLRNCKWTLGRVCSTQEKADILTWLSSQ